ncbi:hypothetical protein J4Q44_G00168920 [Coregonus suidteri]|uniref:BAG domain-containing protein n=1 Tax=Coregonus suidteri TaxID=861788 RepID=A0AAN8LKR0_9TELE
MATVSITLVQASIRQVLSTHPIHFTVQTRCLPGRPQASTLARAAQDQSRAQGGQDNHTPSTNIRTTTILDHTVKGPLAIFLGLTRTMGKVVLRCPHTPLDKPFTIGHRLRLGPTRVGMGGSQARSGGQAPNLHTATMGPLSAPNNPQPGQGLALEHHPPMKPRTSTTQDPISTSVTHRWDPNPDRPTPLTPLMASLLTSAHLPRCTINQGGGGGGGGGGAQEPKPSQGEPPPPVPAPAQPQGPIGPQCLSDNPSLAKVQQVIARVLLLHEDVDEFVGKKSDKSYRYLEELLAKELLVLDSVETQGQEVFDRPGGFLSDDYIIHREREVGHKVIGRKKTGGLNQQQVSDSERRYPNMFKLNSKTM